MSFTDKQCIQNRYTCSTSLHHDTMKEPYTYVHVQTIRFSTSVLIFRSSLYDEHMFPL